MKLPCGSDSDTYEDTDGVEVEETLTPEQKAFADKCIDILNRCMEREHGGPFGPLNVEYEVVG